MSNEQVRQVSGGGLSLGTILFVVFLTLRLTDNIDWAWFWVAAPLWIPLGIAVAIILLVVVFAFIGGALSALKGHRL